MRPARIFRIDKICRTLSGHTAPEIELVCHGYYRGVIADAELADESGAITILPQHRGIRLRPSFIREWLAEIFNPVPSHVLAGKNGGAATAADRSGDKMILEQHTLGCQPVNVRRENIRIAHATERVQALVIRQNEQDVWLPGCGGLGRFCHARLAAKDQQSSQCENGVSFHD